MDLRLKDILQHREKNYLLPFFWMSGGGRAQLTERLQTVYESGARAVCLESRTHEGFCEEEWWEDLRILLEEAERLGMRVWVLDDRHFPTGFANGLIAKKYPERRKWQLIEHHLDIIGPAAGAAVIPYPAFSQDELLGIFLCRRSGEKEALTGETLDVSGSLQDGLVICDVPEGLWRMFFLYQSRRGVNPSQKDYIHLIDEESVDVLIEAVYQPHYEHFARYFGNVFAGFFSDEPCLGNIPFSRAILDNDIKNKKMGMPGLALPWSSRLQQELTGTLGAGSLSLLPGLWYPMQGVSEKIRYAYMDILTRRYRDAFSRRLGDWCRAHGVEYIGHIIEDMNAHARLGCSTGHYFRGLDGQDMSGMDIVLHQTLPGFANWQSSASCSGGVADPEFYHYVLPALCSSMAALNPRTQGRAMCEIFGAYGWAEGVPMMKWLIDHLLVRGINHFVPHAFSSFYPNPDCPPHFHAEGNDPQYPGFCRLMGYVNRAAHLLCGAKPVAETALLYHAEAEWSSPDRCMLMQRPAKKLADAHIPFEILPLDYLQQSEAENGSFTINGLRFRCLVIPEAACLPPALFVQLNRLQNAGVCVLVATEQYGECGSGLTAVPLEGLVDAVQKALSPNEALSVEGDWPLLRAGQWTRGNTRLFMFFNESVTEEVRTEVRLPCRGEFLHADLLGEEFYARQTQDGRISLQLQPYESVILIFTETEGFPAAKPVKSSQQLQLRWDVSLLENGLSESFVSYRQKTELFNLQSPAHRPGFSGTIRYEGTLQLEEEMPDCWLDLGQVGQTARLWVNGQEAGIRICPPYRYRLPGLLHAGKNTLRIEVANTLANRLKDSLSCFLPIPPTGLLGPLRLLWPLDENDR